MRPMAIYDLLAHDSELTSLGITPSRVKELQSVDSRPFESGYFIICTLAEEDTVPVLRRGPRALSVWVHTPWNKTRNYGTIDAILDRIDAIFADVEQYVGTDGVRVSRIRYTGQSGNLRDEAWETITRFSTYGVLYDKSAA